MLYARYINYVDYAAIYAFDECIDMYIDVVSCYWFLRIKKARLSKSWACLSARLLHLAVRVAGQSKTQPERWNESDFKQME